MERVTSISSSEWKTVAILTVFDEQNKKSTWLSWYIKSIKIKKDDKLDEFNRLIHELRIGPRRFHFKVQI